MTIQARAIYENGYLRLLDDIQLGAGQEVRLIIEPTQEEDLFYKIFGDSVIMPDPSNNDDADLENELEEIARAFSGGKSLSEMIIEDRQYP